MALAEYFRRSAVAAAQVLSGYDEDAIRARLAGTTVGVSVGTGVMGGAEGAALAEFVVRLLARLYPRLTLTGDGAAGLTELARGINPLIDLDDNGAPDVVIAVGRGAAAAAPTTIYAGSDGWDAYAGTTREYDVGDSPNPLGASVAACLACANVFRAVFARGDLDHDVRLSALETDGPAPDLEQLDVGEVVLVGGGAVGSATAWALGRSAVRGRLHVVDHETIDLGNLQRYVVARPEHVGRPKTDVLAEALSTDLELVAHHEDWAAFCEGHGRAWPRVLVAVDSAGTRREVQAALPRWIANAWTQPGDLGVSVHPWTADGACLSCLYLPAGSTPSHDVVVARALGLEGMEVEVRRLLYQGAAPAPELLDRIADALDVDRDAVAQYEGRPLRALYTEGICGGTVLPLDRAGRPAQDVHVPLAHQSALAGVLLAASAIADAAFRSPKTTTVTRLDVLRTVPMHLRQPAAKDPRGICICQDPVYQRVWASKWA